MVYFQRTYPAPPCLEIEFSKPNGDYRCSGVATQLQLDFKNKCYLCEQQAPTSINIEHFRAHRGKAILKFAWANLFYVCGHCNNTKQAVAARLGILDCTRVEHPVDTCLSYRFSGFPREQEVQIGVVEPCKRADNTVVLLKAIYNGHPTEQKMIQAANLRQHLGRELKMFKARLRKYLELEVDDPERVHQRNLIISHLQNSSAFTAFKRWIIRENETLFAEFGGEF